MSEAVGAGRDGAAPGAWSSWYTGAACLGMNASASARGQADSLVVAAGGGGATGRGASGAGTGAKRLLRTCGEVAGSSAGAIAAPFGSRRLFTRAINSCG